MVGSRSGWLGVVVARQADLSGWLEATGQRASSAGILLPVNGHNSHYWLESMHSKFAKVHITVITRSNYHHH